MVKDHLKDRADVRKAIREIRDPELKAWAKDELATVEEHLRLAEDLQKKYR